MTILQTLGILIFISSLLLILDLSYDDEFCDHENEYKKSLNWGSFGLIIPVSIAIFIIFYAIPCAITNS